MDRIELAAELSLVLVVPALTPTLEEEATSLGWKLQDVAGGYHRVHGSEYAGLAPEERLAGLTPEQAILALPDEILRGLSPEFISKLPAHVQVEIRKRLSH